MVTYLHIHACLDAFSQEQPSAHTGCTYTAHTQWMLQGVSAWRPAWLCMVACKPGAPTPPFPVSKSLFGRDGACACRDGACACRQCSRVCHAHRMYRSATAHASSSASCAPPCACMQAGRCKESAHTHAHIIAMCVSLCTLGEILHMLKRHNTNNE